MRPSGMAWIATAALLVFVAVPSNAQGSATGSLIDDFDGDGYSDVVAQRFEMIDGVEVPGQAEIWLMGGRVPNHPPYPMIQRREVVTLPPNIFHQWEVVGVGDFNGDRKPDIVWHNGHVPANIANVVWIMDGLTYVEELVLPPIGSDWRIAAIADFDGDHKSDLVMENLVINQREVWLMDGVNYRSSLPLPAVTSPDWSIRGCGDFNGDGHPDLVWQNLKALSTEIWLMNGNAHICCEAILPPSSSWWQVYAVHDADGDGSPDLLFRSKTLSCARYSYWLMRGQECLTAAAAPQICDGF